MISSEISGHHRAAVEASKEGGRGAGTEAWPSPGGEEGGERFDDARRRGDAASPMLVIDPGEGHIVVGGASIAALDANVVRPAMWRVRFGVDGDACHWAGLSG